MPNRDPYFMELSIIDSALADVVYSPDEVALFGQVLDDICCRAAERVPLTDGLRTMLAAAILEGALLGMREHEDLATFALRAIPVFRRVSA